MRLKKLLWFCVFLLSVNAQAQDLKIMVNKKGKVGFADQSGNEVIKCQFESALPFVDGTAIVIKGGKWGLIDETGKVVLPLKYTQISPWTDQIYLLKNGKKMGLADHQGKLLLPANYTLITKPNCYGKALIGLGGSVMTLDKKNYLSGAKQGIIDAQGNVLVTPKYKGLHEFSLKMAGAYPCYEGRQIMPGFHNMNDTLVTDCAYLGFTSNGAGLKAGLMDGSGKELVKQGLYDELMEPQSGMMRYYIKKKKQTICGYHNLETGQKVEVATFDTPFDKLTFWTHGDFIGDIAPVNGSTWSFVDKSGSTLRTGYKSLQHSLITGLWAAQKSDGTWDVFDDANHDVETLTGYQAIRFPAQEGDKEVFTVQKDGQWGAVSRAGNVVVPLMYDMALANNYDIIAVMKNDKWGMLTADNQTIVPLEYIDEKVASERGARHFWVKKADSLYYHYNADTKHLASQGYKNAQNFVKGLAIVQPAMMTVENNPLNKAQMYAPNTDKETIDKVVPSENVKSFVYIVNTNDELVFSQPVSTIYADRVKDEIVSRGNRPLTQGEMKDLLLKMTVENRMYDLESTLGEDEWNY